LTYPQNYPQSYPQKIRCYPQAVYGRLASSANGCFALLNFGWFADSMLVFRGMT